MKTDSIISKIIRSGIIDSLTRDQRNKIDIIIDNNQKTIMQKANSICSCLHLDISLCRSDIMDAIVKSEYYY
jgi:hypothetical protein